MKEDLGKKLITSFPILYQDFNSFECDDGWFDIIYNLSEKLEPLIAQAEEDDDGRKPRCLQSKEKFGSLRFYISRGSDEIYKLIHEAEAKSEKTCELCGMPGENKTKGYWMMTRCQGCWEKELKAK